MITTFYPPYHFGGDGIFVHSLAHELAERGHHVEIIFNKDAYRLLARREPDRVGQSHPNIVVHGLESPLGAWGVLAMQQAGAPLFYSQRIRAILAQGFDVIHYHNISLVGGPQVLTYGEGIKLYMCHEYWLVCPTHVMFRYNREACPAPRCLSCALSQKRPPQFWRYTGMIKAATRHVDLFLLSTRFAMVKHRERGLELPMVHMPYFVPRPFSNGTGSAPKLPSDPRPYFLYAGRLEPLKGVQTLIPLFRDYPRARLVIAGAGSLEAELHTQAAGSENIVFVGTLSPAQLEPLMRDAVAVLMPVLSYEVGPLVLLEAFREKTPVIGRKIGGVAEVIEDAGGGLLYEDDEQLRAALDQLLDDQSLRNALGLCAYETYQRQWTPEAYLARYFKLIEGLQVRKANSPLPSN